MSPDRQLAVAETTYKVEPYAWMDPVRNGLQAVELRLLSAPDGQHEWLGLATDHLFSAGGKRIRPAVSLLACGVFDVDLERSVSLAAGVEMLHTATLVHDDIIDRADQRRGRPTINSVSGGDASILVGDYLFARAANLVAETDSVRVMDDFAKTLMVILNGEVVQRFTRWEPGRQAYTQRIYAKTGALFVLAAEAGAVLGGAEAAEQQAMEQFGRAVGMAFQIVDDVLDYTGEAARIGKPAGSDLRQGLITLPLICYLESHPGDPDVAELLARKDGENPAVERVVDKVRRSDAAPAALAEARAYVETARDALELLPPSIYTQNLSDLALTVVERAI